MVHCGTVWFGLVYQLGMAMQMRKMRIHADDVHIYKAYKRIYADADAMRMMRIAKNCRMAIPNTNT